MKGESRKGKIIFAAVLILLCAVISGVTGAATSLFIFNLMPDRVRSASAEPTQEVIYDGSAFHRSAAGDHDGARDRPAGNHDGAARYDKIQE